MERKKNQFLLCTKHWHFKDQAAIAKLGGLTHWKHLMISRGLLLSEESNGEKAKPLCLSSVYHMFTLLEAYCRYRGGRGGGGGAAVVGIFISVLCRGSLREDERVCRYKWDKCWWSSFHRHIRLTLQVHANLWLLCYAVTSVRHVGLEEAFCSFAISFLTPFPHTHRHTHTHTHMLTDLSLWTLLSLSAAGGLSLVWACVCMNACAWMCVCMCVQIPSKACCSALLCWPGHVATLKLLSESPVKLLRSSTTLAVGSGNPFASCSLHTPLPASLPSLCLSCPPLLCVHLLRFSMFAPISLLSFCLYLFVARSWSLCLFLAFSFSLSLFPISLSVPRSDRGICIIYVVKHHCGPSVSFGAGPGAHVFSCIPAQIAGNALWQPIWNHVWQWSLFRKKSVWGRQLQKQDELQRKGCSTNSAKLNRYLLY